jgi:hypothetical protein
MTPQEELLAAGSSRRLCFTCQSPKLRPLIVLAKEGFPPGDSRHVFSYSHDAYFGCDDCPHGYVEIRRHDCFDFEDVYDQDQVCALDGNSIARLKECLPRCPEPLSETCKCKVHESLRKSWGHLPNQVWDRYTGELPSVILQIADPDHERVVISGVWVGVMNDLPRIMAKDGKWPVYDAKGKLKAEGGFSRGQLTGHWTFWHANGQKKSEGEYHKDLREGKWVEWNERGEVVAEQIFHEGQPIKS